jgi:hypothetical protein
VGAASLGWLSPVVLRELEIRDATGRPLLFVPELQSRKSLLDLLLGSSDLGHFRCERPSLQLICSGRKTNLEEVFARWLKPGPRKSAYAGLAGVEVVDARLTVHDDDTHQQWTLNPVNCTVGLSRDRSESVQLKLNALLPDSGQSGRIEADLAMNPAGSGGGQLAVRLDRVPLALTTPLLRRTGVAAQLDGRLTGRVAGRWGGEETHDPDLRLDGTLSGTGVAVVGRWLREERLCLGRLEGAFRLTVQGTRLCVERAEAQCDLGRASVLGIVVTTASRTAFLAGSQGEVAADIDLARVVNALPQTLHLRAGVRVTAGRLRLDVSSSSRAEESTWHGTLQTDGVAVLTQGRQIIQPQAITLLLDAHQSRDAFLVVDRFHGESSFFRLEGSGSRDRLTVDADCDFGRLATELSHLVDLNPARIQGQGSAQVVLQRREDGGFTAQCEGQLRGLQVPGPDGLPWREDRVRVHMDLAGKRLHSGTLHFDAAALRVEAGPELVELQLLEPVQDIQQGPWGLWRLHAHGDLASWHRRLQPWLGAADTWRLAGSSDLTAQLRSTAGVVKLEEMKLALRGMDCRGPDFSLSERAVDLEASGCWQAGTRKLELTDTRLTSGTLAVQAPRVEVVLPRRGPVEGIGSAELQGDLARLQAWVHLAKAPSEDLLSGRIAGRIDWRLDGGRLSATVDVNLLDLARGPSAASGPEAQVHLVCRGSCEPAAELVQFDQVQVESAVLSGSAQGRIARLKSSRDLLLTGKLRYDLEKLTALLGPSLAAHVKVSGRDARPFRIEGSLAGRGTSGAPGTTVGPPLLSLAGLSAETSLGWQSAEICGFQAGPAELQARFEGGWLRVQPFETLANGGRLRLAPSLRLEPGPAEFHFGAGTVIDQVGITPAVCTGLLGHAAPILAGVTDVEGQLSLRLEGGRLPLAAPSTGQIDGTLTIHSVRIGSSPLLRELAVLLQGPPTLTLSRETVVPFRLVDKRVHHRDLELAFPEVTIRTSGSVGLDGSLDLMAEMPVPPKWLGHGKVAAAVAKQMIRLPIHGTLQKPRLDEQVLRTVSAQFLRETANDLLRQEADKQLKRMIRPRQ